MDNDIRNKRKRLILVAAKEPVTLKQLATTTGMSYKTCWQYVNELRKERLMFEHPRIINGSMAFVAKVIDIPVPELINAITEDTLPFYAFVQSPETVTQAMRELHLWGYLVSELITAVQYDDIERCEALRNNFQSLSGRMTMMVDFCQQIINCPNFYDMMLLKRIASNIPSEVYEDNSITRSQWNAFHNANQVTPIIPTTTPVGDNNDDA